MGQQVMGQQHGLGPLQVGVAGQVHVGGVGGPLGQRLLQRHDVVGHPHEGAPAPQAQVGRHLVVAAAPGVQLGPDVAGQLGDPALDGRVDVLVAGGVDEDAGGELLLDQIERIDERAHLAVAQDSDLAQPLHVGARADQVVEGQDLVVGQAHGEVGHGVGHTRRDASLPQRHDAPLPVLVRAAFCAPGPWRADHVATPRPHRRTKPSASWCRNVSEAS